jgi:thioredoxin reductase (NADPH)
VEQYDIVIVGGGMAGLSAALYGGWLGRKVFLAERQMFGGQIVNADRIENYPALTDGVLGADLVSQLRMQAIKFGAKMQYVEITGMEARGSAFRLHTTEEPIEAKTVIIATGGKPRALGLQGESGLEGRGVSHCATCDGPFFAAKPVAVVGGGDTALDEALYLSKIASKVTIIHDGEIPSASDTLLRRAKEVTNIEFVANATVEEIIGNDSVEGVRLTNSLKKNIAGLFIATGFEPETSLFKHLVDFDPMGHIAVDLHMQTSVSGVFAVGYARQGSAGQLASVSGDGVTAAVAAHRHIKIAV